MPTHSQIIIAAPDRHLGAFPPSDGVILSKGEHLGAPVHGLEHSVRVIILFLRNLFNKEAVVVVAGANCEGDSCDLWISNLHIPVLLGCIVLHERV